MNRDILYALMAAALFGASTPFAKLLVGEVSPLLLGGLLYLGSGVGLSAVRIIRDGGWKASGLAAREWPWLLGAIFFGGILGPVALLYGLISTPGSTASLLLNLEAVLTAVIAWVVFRENADRRIVLGMIAIVAGGIVLSWPSASAAGGTSGWFGPVAIAAACACWAIDNNLTRKVSASDALFIAGSKGFIAGLVNLTLALSLGARLPDTGILMATASVGLFGYGISLVMFVLALRGLGSARTGAYFSTAPFIGAVVALALLGESTTPAFWLASALMTLGVWLHLTEDHTHEHTHYEVEHRHRHMHDTHHEHAHDSPDSADLHGSESQLQGSHDHLHRHAKVTHKHPHFPDIHHRHTH